MTGTEGATRKRPLCPCGGTFTQKQSRFGPFWSCDRFPACNNMAKRSKHDELWRVSDKAIRQARIRAHDAFDRLWQYPVLKRGHCYSRLRDVLGIEQKHCHIEHFDIGTCAVVEAWATNLLAQLLAGNETRYPKQPEPAAALAGIERGQGL